MPEAGGRVASMTEILVSRTGRPRRGQLETVRRGKHFHWKPGPVRLCVDPMPQRRLHCLLLAIVFVCPALAVNVEGVVLRDDTGAALVSAEVRVAREGERYLTADLETGRDGRFRATDLPEGRYTLTVAKPGYLPTTVAMPTEAVPLAIRLVRTASISGRALWREGTPIENARVNVMERTKSGSLQRPRLATAYASTKRDGGFRLHSLPPGNYVLAMSHQSGEQSGGTLYPEASNPRLFALKGGEEIRDCDFIADAEASFAVSGKVEAPTPAEPTAGNPNRPSTPAKLPAMYSVGIAPAVEPSILISWTQTDATGAFKFPAVPWGEYLLFGAGPTMGYGGTGSLLARDAEHVFGSARVLVSGPMKEVRVPLAQARSAVLRLEASKFGKISCPGALELRLSAVESWGTELTQTVSLPFDEPRTVNNLAPARYEISLARQEENCGLSSSAVLDLREGSGPKPFVLTAGGKGSIAGRIADPRGGVALEVVVLPLGSARAAGITVQPVAADGRFRFPDLPPGRYGLNARVSGGEGATPMLSGSSDLIEVEVLGGEVEIVMNAPLPEKPTRSSVP